MNKDIDSLLMEYYEQIFHPPGEDGQTDGKEMLMAMIDQQQPVKSLFKTLEF